MILIGESLNSTIPTVNNAVVEKDKNFIITLAKRQVECGANYLDVNGGTGRGNEGEDLAWMINLIQNHVECPLCLDSSDPKALRLVSELYKGEPFYNSICAEPAKMETMLPLIAEKPCKVIALAHGKGGIPETSEERIVFAKIIINELRKAGMTDSNIFLDPVLFGLSTNEQAGNIALDTIRILRKEFSDINIVLPISNIGFGMPKRHVLNSFFASMCVEAGANAFICDVRERLFMNSVIASQTILGQDKYCKKYIKAYKKKLLI